MRRAFFAAALLLIAVAAAAEVAVPPLKARVTDLTSTLSADQRAGLEARLASFEQRKGSQLAVLLVPTTQPETIEQYSIRVAEQWKLGRKGIDDGALLLIAMNDHAVRIEVGYGLEGVLPDAVAKRIVADDVVPRFKQKDFFGGIDAGVTRMMAVIDGEKLPPPRSAAQGEKSRPFLDSFYDMVGLGFLLVVVFGSFLRAMFGRFVGSTLIGVAGGALTWLIVGSLIFGVIFGIIALILSLTAGVPGGRGGWASGGWSSGGGSFGGGGGGFSGGGGSFGGGGASGSW